MKLTIQVHENSHWKDAFWVRFHDPEKGFAGKTSYGYETAYIVDNLDRPMSRLSEAVSYCFPVDFNDDTTLFAPAFLHDIAPAGAARQSLMRRLQREKPEGLSSDVYLLGRCTPAPIGNMRVKESVPHIKQSLRIGFGKDEVIELNTGFVEHAYDQGAAIGGASGAGGAAPKILMTEDAAGLMYPDASLPDDEAVTHWFIKFPRGKSLDEDVAILHSEFLYYQAINKLGMETISTDGMSFFEGQRPSLWMRRFDRKIADNRVHRSAVESMYSLAGMVVAGQHMWHEDAIGMLAKMWSHNGQQNEIPELVSEYLRRDLLNRILGNTDNHGRNTSIIRGSEQLRLAPIYDLAPMVMDREIITRTTKWHQDVERGGVINWLGVCKNLGQYADPDMLYQQLMADAALFIHLPDILQPDLPAETWNHPGVHLANLKHQLKAWGLA